MTKYSDWARYFEQNVWPEFGVAGGSLSKAERDLVAQSIGQFQLGEDSGGRTLLALGREFAGAAGEPGYLRSLELFIAEEQRHASMLGRFMDGEGIPRLTRDRADRVFRLVRKLWGLECMLTVLMSAECVALPYYSALHEATQSAALRAICRQILRDEAMHLKYQGQTLARLGAGRGFWMTSVAQMLQRGAVLGAATLVYAQHRRFFRAVGWPWEDVLEAAFQGLTEVQRRSEGARRSAKGQKGHLCLLK